MTAKGCAFFPNRCTIPCPLVPADPIFLRAGFQNFHARYLHDYHVSDIRTYMTTCLTEFLLNISVGGLDSEIHRYTYILKHIPVIPLAFGCYLSITFDAAQVSTFISRSGVGFRILSSL